MSLISIVEGHGEEEALPVLLRLVAAHIDPTLYVDMRRPLRVPRTKLVRPGELERHIQLAARKVGADGRILVVIDADDDCPAHLGPALLERAQRARPDMITSVVLARSEFESWLLAGASGIAGERGLSDELQPPADPESIRDAKGWLSARMPDSTYKETRDQAALASRFDMAAARDASAPHFSDSFDKFWRECEKLFR
ncbi:DUF4276 family protein [Bradymonadaceae bacterium TMQ3]|nr:DUF4276 family protein [Bradymonadaceae bacterium TMQ3]TXC76879.1 DUF4276 family protein [Bradymonadales bacterium TMQ1]